MKLSIVEPSRIRAGVFAQMVQSAAFEQKLPILLHEVKARVIDMSEPADIYMLSIENGESPQISFAQILRETKQGTYILFIVYCQEDIWLCIRPSLRPDGILVHPVMAGKLGAVLSEICVSAQKSVLKDCFYVKAGSMQYNIFYDDIMFFEARNKKIALKTRAQELLFYSSLEKVLAELPSSFVQCHKGFIINLTRVASIDFVQMTLLMHDGCIIPFSRSYKTTIRDLYGRNKK